jgi:hypothetical protein
MGKDLASIPSLKSFDAKNGLTFGKEEGKDDKKEAKKALV